MLSNIDLTSWSKVSLLDPSFMRIVFLYRCPLVGFDIKWGSIERTV